MPALLELERLSKHFGGIYVSREISLSVRKGEISAIIGPNGAGKTTLFNQITGHILPDGGAIRFSGQEITGLRPDQVAVRGIGRAFQVAQVFGDETALTNVLLAVLAHRRESRSILRPTGGFRESRERAESILDALGIGGRAGALAGELSHGDQKLLDIGIALAQEPELLLLDEPTAGMSPEERVKTSRLIRDLHGRYGLTTVFIEHDMDMVFGIADTVRVLVQGALLAEGSPEEIQSHPGVIEAYLGEEVLA